jgi:uncharacterized repeat protein (TIGR02543 family)
VEQGPYTGESAQYGSAGIAHTYATSGTYTVTITPAGVEYAWLAAFGFASHTLAGTASEAANKARLTKVLTPITPSMTRTTLGLAPANEWAYTFAGCTNLVMGDEFTFDAQAWASVTTVGDGFALGMFAGCSGASFTMNDVFNLPQNITSVGALFVGSMFSGCSGASFTMNEVFNLPQNITGTVGAFFAAGTFYRCSGASFTMNNVFNLPQGITSVGERFAEYMFGMAASPVFQVSPAFRFPALSQAELNKTSVFAYTFSGLTQSVPMAPAQQRSALSIINNTRAPSTQRFTFGSSSGLNAYSSCFSDFNYLPLYWRIGLTGNTGFTRFAVEFYSEGGSTAPLQIVAIGAQASEPVVPTRAGYTFEGWYAELFYGTLDSEPYDFTAPVTANVFLHAAWQPDGEQVGAPHSGDIDGDGYVTAADAVMAAHAVVAGSGTLTPAQRLAADIDGDGALTMADVIAMMHKVVGL